MRIRLLRCASTASCVPWAVLSAILPGLLCAGTCHAVGTAQSSVAIVSAPTDSDIESSVRQAVALAGGLPQRIAPGKKIVIQPNLTEAGWPSGSGIITDARVVRAVIRLCIERGVSPVDITICEGSAAFHGSSAGYTDRQMTLKAFKDSGLDTNADLIDDETGARLVDANNAGRLYPSYPDYSGPYDAAYVTRIIKPNFLINRVYCLPNVVAQCDALIRIPSLKTHNLAGVTGALKLSFGHAASDIYHGGWTSMYKWNLLHFTFWGDDELTTNAKGIADMTNCRPPDLVVLDGLVGVPNGPCGGPNGGGGAVNIPPGGVYRLVAASRDPVAHDTIQTLLCGYETSIASVPALAYAASVGLGVNNPGRIEVRGLHVQQARRWMNAWGSGDPGDRIPPTLSNINVILNSAKLLSVTPVSPFDAKPGVAKGELYVDGTLVDANHAFNFGTQCSLIGASAGQHQVKYTLYDGMLNETSVTRTLTLDASAPLADILTLPDSATVYVGPFIFTGRAPSLGEQAFFVSTPDGTRGLRVQTEGAAPYLQPGQSVSLYGAMGTLGGQRILLCSSYSAGGLEPEVRPKLMSNRALGGVSQNPVAPGVPDGYGPYNLGCLVRTYGKVTGHGQGCFYIRDGSISTPLRVLSVSGQPPAVGKLAIITGFSCVDNSSGEAQRLLVPRASSDILEF